MQPGKCTITLTGDLLVNAVFTLIPLDLIFIDSDREIVDIKHGEKKSPDLIRPERLCRYVLEVNKDFCRHKNIKIGDKVRI